MAGMGRSRLGGAAYGVGTPATAPATGGTILDKGEGTRTGSRMIDEHTRQYAFDDFGRVRGMSDARQMVLLATATRRGTAKMRDLGQELHTIEEIGEDFERRVQSTLTSCVQHLVTKGMIEVIAITIDRIKADGTTNDRGAFIRFRWRDLTDPSKPEHAELIA